MYRTRLILEMLVFENSTLIDLLEDYVKDILVSFRNDRRIALLDLYNEPSNGGYGEKLMPLLKKVSKWSWEVRTS